ncbi:hypothetical protein [Ferrimicrobium sp.]|uniref:hypothetical protein n=1 Tax=Ferrimicrobium sp. TaxID=2926050 RepID=UPI0026262503|nr:hypothetical protein [Ferrimicrobium sp.]
MANDIEILEAEIKAHHAMVEVKQARFDREISFTEFYGLVEAFTKAAAEWETLKDGADDGRSDFE